MLFFFCSLLYSDIDVVFGVLPIMYKYLFSISVNSGLTDSQVAMHRLVNAFIKSHLWSYVQYIQQCYIYIYIYRITFYVEKYMLNIIFVISSSAAQPMGECYD